jgi:hypothetical protein
MIRTLSSLLLLLLLTSLGACSESTAQRRKHRPVDRMVFRDAPEENAYEKIPLPPQRVRVQGGTHTATIGAVAGAQLFQMPTPLCQSGKEVPSRSIGPTTDGQLQNACRIPGQGTGYIAVSPNAFGTDNTIALLQMAAAQVNRAFEGVPAIVIGAISAENGGFLRPHKSHQSGRDVDIAYMRTSRGQPRRFELTDASNLDAERTWAFLEALLSTGEVGWIFMDYEIQALLYEALLDNGWTEQGLAPLFQYPAGANVPRGVIRHATGHADHFHVRFRCPEADKPDCVD